MKNVKKVKNLALVFILLTGLGFSNVFGQEKESPTLYAVMFYADDWGESKLMVAKGKEGEYNQDADLFNGLKYHLDTFLTEIAT